MLDSVEFKYTCTWKINTDSNVNKLAAVDCDIRYDDAFYLIICMFVCLCIIRIFFFSIADILHSLLNIV